MDWKKLACMVAIGLMAVGCGDDDDTDTMGDDPGDDTPPVALDCTGADDQCLFVASTLSIGVEDMNGNVPGFDIDGRISDATDDVGCNQEDWVSPEGVMGIDNQLASLAPTLEAALGEELQPTIDGAIADGSIIILMDIKGLEFDDDDVTMDLALGSTADGEAPMLSGSALAPGQTFTIDMTYVEDAPGTVSDGLLDIQLSTLPLSIPFDETTVIALTIRDARVQATVTATPSLDGGLIGGSLNIDELVTTVEEVAPDIDPALIQTTLEGVADLEPDGDGICQNVSVGITFEGVEANAS
jgi:hypothetical protein